MSLLALVDQRRHVIQSTRVTLEDGNLLLIYSVELAACQRTRYHLFAMSSFFNGSNVRVKKQKKSAEG